MELFLMVIDRSIGKIGTIPSSRPSKLLARDRSGRNKTQPGGFVHITCIPSMGKNWAMESCLLLAKELRCFLLSAQEIKLTFCVNNNPGCCAATSIYQTQDTANICQYHARHFCCVQKEALGRDTDAFILLGKDILQSKILGGG